MRAQTSIEYVLAMVGLLILLIALYEMSVGMNGRLAAMQARIEGERTAAQLGRALDAADVLGPGAQINISLYSFPATRLILKESEIVALGASDDQAAAFGRMLGRMNAQTSIYANGSMKIDNTGGALFVAPMGS